MGFDPRVIDRLSLWEFTACVIGWMQGQGIKPPGKSLEDDRLRQLGIDGFD